MSSVPSSGNDGAERKVRVSDTLRRAQHHLPGARRGTGVTLVLAGTGAAGRLILPLLLQTAIDRGFDTKVGTGRLAVNLGVVIQLCGVAAIATVLTQLATRTAAYRLGSWSENMMATLRRGCVDRFLSMSLDQHTREKRGVLVARATTDVESISRFFEWGAISWLVNSVIVVVLGGFLLATNLRLGLLAICFALPVAFIMRRVQRHLLHAYEAVRAHVGAYLGRTSEIVSGAAVIRAYGAEPVMRSAAFEAIEGRKRSTIRAGIIGALLFPVGDLFATFAVASIVVAGVAMGPGAGLTDGTVVAVIFATIRLLDPVSELSETIDQTQLAVAGLSRVLDVLDTPTEVSGPAVPTVVPEGAIGVALDGVWYAYPPRPDDEQSGAAEEALPWALHDVHLVVAAGSSLAIVGATGSGKSTTARLLARLADPQQGTVRLGGVDIRDVDDQEVRRRVQLVPQEPFLFDVSIGENIRVGRLGATDDEIAAVVARLGLEDWLAALPNGLSTRAGERGSELSAGERQLVALLRAELIGPDVLVLDEATSSVDAATESRLAGAIDRMARGRTLIVIAHRLSTAARLERIAVFEAGRLVEHGTHAELRDLDGPYARLAHDWSASVS